MRGAVGGVAGLVVLATASGAVAEERGSTVDELIVTARRKVEGLQDAPVSVTALSAETMVRTGVVELKDVALRVPGLQYGNFGDVKLSPTSLRGVTGSSGSAGSDPAIAYYVDDVFLGQGAGANLDLYDIDRVEVLRGPQGALFGRNAIGGVISITTQRPTATPTASLTGDLGNYSAKRLGGSVSGPLPLAGWSGKLSGIYADRDGTSENVFLGQRVNDENAWSLRGQLLYQWSADADLLLSADYRQVDQHPLAFETLKYNPNATLTQLLDLEGIAKNLDPFDRKVSGDSLSKETLKSGGVSATLHFKLGDVAVTSVSAYRKHDYFSRTDTDRTPLKIAYDGDPEKVWRGSEELRFERSGERLDWLAGAYYLRQQTTNLSFIEIGSDLAALLGAPGLTGFKAGSNGKLETTSVSIFGSLTWRFTPKLELSAAVRSTTDRKKIDYTQSDPLGLLGGDGAVRASSSWSETTPSFSLRYKLDPDVMLYATASKGFKSGGFNDALGDANGIAFGPERLWNYEAGLKSEFLDHRVRLNLAAYYMDWTSIQIIQDNPITPVYDPTILNGGAAHTQGVELELEAHPTDTLRFDAAVAVQSARYDGGTLPDGKPLQVIPFAPSYTATFQAERRWAIGGWGEGSLLAEYIARGRTYLTANNDPDGRVSPYGLLNLRASVEPVGGKWRLTLWGKNLTDETYVTRLFDAYGQDLVGQKFIALGDPRTYGVEFAFRF